LRKINSRAGSLVYPAQQKSKTNSLLWELPSVTDFTGHRLRITVQGLAQRFGLHFMGVHIDIVAKKMCCSSAKWWVWYCCFAVQYISLCPEQP